MRLRDRPNAPARTNPSPQASQSKLDFAAHTALASGAKHQRRGGAVLHGDADRLVEGELIWPGPARLAPRHELADLGVHVVRIDQTLLNRLEQIVGARWRRRQSGPARLNDNE